MGVLWDEPERGGPTWSAEGGGRGGRHLLVTEAAAELLGGGGTKRPEQEFDEEDFKAARFKRRFNRSPTESELELSENEWDEMFQTRRPVRRAARMAARRAEMRERERLAVWQRSCKRASV